MQITNQDLNKIKKFRNFDEAATTILQLIGEFIEINTLFIAKNDKRTNTMVKVLNKDYALVEEGSSLPFGETFCHLSVDQGEKTLVIPDLTKSDLTNSMKVTKDLGTGSFIGIPIYYGDGENYGTICGLDNKTFEFTEKHVHLFETMTNLLTYVLELDNANKQIKSLSTPMVPVTSGIAILPIVGDLGENRAEMLMQTAIINSQKMNLEYLVLDLSGILRINDSIGAHLLELVKMLQLIGVIPVLTGLRPDIAVKANQTIDLQSKEMKDVMIEANLERALSRIGLSFVKK